jgi:hypothetical protein
MNLKTSVISRLAQRARRESNRKRLERELKELIHAKAYARAPSRIRHRKLAAV